MRERVPIGDRIRRLRESQDPEPTQTSVATAIGMPGKAGQVWLHRRETNEVDFKYGDLIRVVEVLGYSAELIILPREQEELLAAFGKVDPEDAALVLRLLNALVDLGPKGRKLVSGLVQLAEDQIEKGVAG